MLDQCHNIEKKIPGQIRSVLNVQEMVARALLLDTDGAAPPPSSAGDVLAANQIFMDAFYTDVRRDLAGFREERGLPGDPMAAYLASGYQDDDRGRPRRRLAGRMELTHDTDQRHRRRSRRAEQPARPRPQEHQLRRRQHLRQGHRGRPGDRRGRRAGLGQGLRRRPRHADRVRPGRAAAGPDARADRGLPRRRPRGRDGRGVRLLPARQGRCRAVDRHRHARARRLRARRPPAPRLRHRDRDRRRRRGADQGDLRRPGRLGALAPSRLPARPRHRRDQGGQPAGGRLHPRRPRHHRVGRHSARSPRRTRSGSSTPPRPTSPSTPRPSRSARRWTGTPPCPTPSVAPRPPPSPPPSAALASHDRPMVGHFTDSAEVLDFLASSEHPRLAGLGTSAAPTTSCAPRSSRCCSTCPRRDGRGVDRPAQGAARALPRGLPGLLRPQRHSRLAARSAAPTRSSCWCPASACSASARTSRPPAWPASSTSTRST